MTQPSPSEFDSTWIWEGGGHLSGPAMTALTDGELSLLPEEAVMHADGCPRCAERLGQLALLAADLADILVEQGLAVTARGSWAPDLEPARRALPVAWLVGALAVALAGLAPDFAGLVTTMKHLPVLVARASPTLMRAGMILLRDAIDGGIVSGFGCLSAGLLVLAAIVIARLDPGSASSGLSAMEKGAH